MGPVILLSFTAAANPTLVTVTTLMLLLPSPKRVMLGYLCGALLTSVTLGLVIVFAVHRSSAVSTTQHTLSPAADLALGALALAVAWVLGSGRDQRIAATRQRRRAGKEKTDPRWQRALDKGSPRISFVLGALLTLPGASYLLGLHEIRELGYATAPTVLLIVLFNVVMLLLLELPLAGFIFAPTWTPDAVARAKAWIAEHWHRFALIGFSTVGALLILKGTIGLIS